MLDRMERQAQDMEELSHLSFQPTPQRWARDFPSVLAAAGNAADERLGLDEPFDATGRVEGVEEEDEEKPPVDPNLVSFVMVLRRAEAWRDTSRADLEELQQRLLQQFDTAGLRVCELECGGATLVRVEWCSNRFDGAFACHCLCGFWSWLSPHPYHVVGPLPCPVRIGTLGFMQLFKHYWRRSRMSCPRISFRGRVPTSQIYQPLPLLVLLRRCC